MFFGLSHVDLPVRDLDRAAQFYVEALGFAVRKRGEGHIDLDAAAALIRLVESPSVERPGSIRVAAADVEGGVATLVRHGAELLYETARTDTLTLEGTVRDPDGNTICVWRDLTEDEYGFDPQLPTELTWDPEAEALLKSLLKAVPALFRGLARRKVVKEAELRAQRSKRVDTDLVVRAYISAQSPPNRKRVREPLKKHGYDPDDFAEEFDA